ncbi:MAG: arginine repressor [Clostridia bacterium]|nr:arginine repressor [Clostridia bacterium]MDD4685704.1 arginine repressor [Clostridia bacterium]
MARSTRQSKILELISIKEIETQDELVNELKNLNFDITQATISRDIKELRLIKILSSDSGKYKYAVVENENQAVSNKYILVFKEAVISVKNAQNLCVIKTIKGMATAVCGIIDKLNLENIMGSVCGDDTVMIILPNDLQAFKTTETLNKIAS